MQTYTQNVYSERSLSLVASPCSKWVFAFIFHIRFFSFSFSLLLLLLLFMYIIDFTVSTHEKRQKLSVSNWTEREKIESEKERKNVEILNNFIWTRSNCRNMFFRMFVYVRACKYALVQCISFFLCHFSFSAWSFQSHFSTHTLIIHGTTHFVGIVICFQSFLDATVVTKFYVQFNQLTQKEKR